MDAVPYLSSTFCRLGGEIVSVCFTAFIFITLVGGRRSVEVSTFKSDMH